MKLAISSCLLGIECRYSGEHTKDDFIVDVLSKYFEFLPICPEHEILGTPRESMRLVEVDVGIKAIGNKSQNDYTSLIENEGKKAIDLLNSEKICGYIFKSKSPSCGMERVKVYNGVNSSLNVKKGVGVFSKVIQDNFLYLPMEEEGRLQDDWLRENFLMQLFAYSNLQELLENANSIHDLIEFHTSYKYLILSKSTTSYEKLGQITANMDKLPFSELISSYKDEFLKAISIKSSINKTYNVLQHIYGYFKNDISKEEKAVVLESLDEFKDRLIPLIVIIKLFNLYIYKFNIEYLKKQKFLNPYPKELALRSHIKSGK
ncbi:MAG: DUF523 and DUF1722 domain-containing protein [Campylobacterales bacterium]|nr:DUF523 and DUF1722 domain-containing protein [Campylobacterales bacterium]